MTVKRSWYQVITRERLGTVVLVVLAVSGIGCTIAAIVAAVNGDSYTAGNFGLGLFFVVICGLFIFAGYGIAWHKNHKIIDVAEIHQLEDQLTEVREMLIDVTSRTGSGTVHRMPSRGDAGR